MIEVPNHPKSNNPFNGHGLDFDGTRTPPAAHGRQITEFESRSGRRPAQTEASGNPTSAQSHSMYRRDGTNTILSSDLHLVKKEAMDASNSFTRQSTRPNAFPARNPISTNANESNVMSSVSSRPTGASKGTGANPAIPALKPKRVLAQTLPRGSGRMVAPILIDDDDNDFAAPSKVPPVKQLPQGRTSTTIMPSSRSNQAHASQRSNPFAKSASPSLPERFGRTPYNITRLWPGPGTSDGSDATHAEEDLETSMRKKALENSQRPMHSGPLVTLNTSNTAARRPFGISGATEPSSEVAVFGGQTQLGPSQAATKSLNIATDPLKPDIVKSNSTPANALCDQANTKQLPMTDAEPSPAEKMASIEAYKVGFILAGDAKETKEPLRDLMLDDDMQELMRYKALAGIKQARQDKDARDRAAAIVAAEDRAGEAAAQN